MRAGCDSERKKTVVGEVFGEFTVGLDNAVLVLDLNYQFADDTGAGIRTGR